MGAHSAFGTALKALEIDAPLLPNEDTLLHRFAKALGDVLEARGLDTYIIIDAHERRLSGRPDARVGLLFFEVKQAREPLSRAIDQIRRRLLQASQPTYFRGVAYNGLEIAFLWPDGSILAQGRPSDLADLLDTWLVNLAVTPGVPVDIVNLIGESSGATRMSIHAFWDAFRWCRTEIGFVDEAYVIWKGLYSCAVNLNKDVAQTLKQSAGDLGITLQTSDDVEQYLFCVQTYFTTVLRLLLAKGSQFCGFLPGESLREALGPQSIRGLNELSKRTPGVLRLFEPDAFLWFADVYALSQHQEVRSRINTAINSLADCVDFLDLSVVGEDFLRITYQRLFAPPLRRALGEFYTPTNLVSKTLDQCGYTGQKGKRLIDYSCGSGGFLLEAIRRKVERYRHLTPSELLDDILDCVTGMDIHPLAVAMSRVNYLLALTPLFRKGGRPSQLYIPVYWGDALLRVARGQAAHNLVSLHVLGMGMIELPSPSLLDWEFLFETLADVLYSSPAPDETAVYQQLANRYRDSGRELELHRAEDQVRNITAQIVDRHRNRRDMRWLPLLRNAIYLERRAWTPNDPLTGYDYVVGNPPWVRIHNLSDELKDQLARFGYRFFTNGKWKWGASLAQGAGFGNQVDYSAVFVERAFDLLRPGGVLSMIVTSKLATALYGGGLRSELLRRHRIHVITDYSLHPEQFFEGATNYPMIITVSRGAPEQSLGSYDDNIVEVEIHWPDGSQSTNHRRQDELALLRHMGPHTAGAPWALVPSSVKTMIDKMLLSIRVQPMFLGELSRSTVQMGVKTSANHLFHVESLYSTTTPHEVITELEGFKSKTSVEEQESFRVRVPTGLLRPVLRGEHVQAWHIPGLEPGSSDRGQYMLWTHDDETGRPLSEGELPKSVVRFFELHRRELTSRSDYRSGDPIWSIYRVAPSKLGAKVVWAEMARSMRACFVPKQVHVPELGGHLTVIPNQTTYLVPVLSDDAGFLMVGLLNSSPVRAYFCSFAERAQNAYFRHYSWTVSLLPVGMLSPILQESAGISHCSSRVRATVPELIRTSQQLHRVRGEDRGLLDKLDRLVCELFGLDLETDLMAARAYLAKVGASHFDADTSVLSAEEDEFERLTLQQVAYSKDRRDDP